jgi:hypothetical protein
MALQGDVGMHFGSLVQDGHVELVEHPQSYFKINNDDLDDFDDLKALVIKRSQERANALGEPLTQQQLIAAYDLLQKPVYDAAHSDEPPNLRLPLVDAELAHPALAVAMDYIVETFHDVKYLIRTTGSHRCSGKTLVSFSESDLVSESTNELQEAHRVCEIILEEECAFPCPRTITSALKLCEDRRIDDFRLVLGKWAAIKENDAKGEKEFRKELASAKKALRKLDVYKKVGRITTFASVPIAFASLLSGIPLGLALLPIGPCMALNAMRLECEHGWLLFGR